MSGHSFWETLRRDVAGPFIPRRVGQAARAARQGFRPAWSAAPIAPAFASAALESGAIDEARMLGRYWLDSSMRARMLRILRRWMASSQSTLGNEAAVHGLDIARPLIDKRVVEFGLAIPEDLYVKNGRNRYLARRALADVYPPEFQARGRHQDLLDPDLIGMLRASQPMLTTEVRRMAFNPTLKKYIDFDKLEAMLHASNAAKIPISDTALALRAVRAAQYVEWLEGGNA
jgi:asparagine synthase (glutamine-hydrolysing)